MTPRMIRYFHAVWGMRRFEEVRRLSRPAQALLRVVRREWEIATVDLRQESGVIDRKAFNRAMDELQAAMLVVPSRPRSPESRRAPADRDRPSIRPRTGGGIGLIEP